MCPRIGVCVMVGEMRRVLEKKGVEEEEERCGKSDGVEVMRRNDERHEVS